MLKKIKIAFIFTLVFSIIAICFFWISIPGNDESIDLNDYVLLFDARTPGERATSIYMTSGNVDKFIKLSSGKMNHRVPEISKNGEWLTFAATENENEDIYIKSIDGKITKRITSHSAIDSYPRFNNDASEVVFFSDRLGSTRIYRYELKNNKLTQLTYGPGNDYDPALTASGQYLFFTSTREGSMDIYRKDLISGEVIKLTSTNDQNIHSSPSSDGESFLFRSDRSGQHEIYLQSVNNSQVERLTSSKGSKRHPSFSNDEKHVVYQSVNGIGKADIYKLSLADKKEIKIPLLSGANLNPTLGIGRGTKLVEKYGQPMVCTRPIHYLLKILKSTDKYSVYSFLRFSKKFKEVCYL